MSKKHRNRKRKSKQNGEQKHAPSIPVAGTRDTLCQQDISNSHEEEPTELKNHKISLKSIITSSSTYTTIATIVIAWATVTYTCISGRQLEAVKTSFRVSQGAQVSVGRKDGVVAEFVVPKDAQNAEIIMYFQNSGRLPAKFAWGTQIMLYGKGTNGSAGIQYPHPYQGLQPRRLEKKPPHSIGQEGESSIIAPDSVLRVTVGTLSQKELANLPTTNGDLLILGMYDYCDELGNWFKRTFGLRYRGNAPSGDLSFDLAQDTPFPNVGLPEDTPTTHYLPPCETYEENQ